MVARQVPDYPPPIYTFTVRAGDDFSAQLVLSAMHPLHDLAELCIKAIGFDFDHSFGFYDNLTNPYQSSEQYSLFADIEDEESDDNDPGVERVWIGDVFEPGRTMTLLFDYGADWCFPIFCESVLPGKNRRKVKKIVSRTGTPPIQYPDEDEFE